MKRMPTPLTVVALTAFLCARVFSSGRNRVAHVRKAKDAQVTRSRCDMTS